MGHNDAGQRGEAQRRALFRRPHKHYHAAGDDGITRRHPAMNYDGTDPAPIG